MLRIAVLVFIVAATTLAGAAVLVVVSVPSLADQGMKLIPLAALIGVVAAIPLSFIAAKQIAAAIRPN